MRQVSGVLVALSLAGMCLITSTAGAVEFPTKRITITNMYAVGGGTDVVARAIAQKLSEKWNVPVIVESRSGAGGTIAAGMIAKSPPDGYNLLITDVSYSIAPSVYAKLQYDPIKDLQPVILLNTVAQVMVVNPSVPVKTVAELVAYAKANPKKLLYASAGIGSPNHLVAAEFCARAGIEMTHVPYRGAVPALTDVVAGRVNMYIGALASAVPFIMAGKLRALAVMQKDRVSLLSDVPSIADAGYSDIDSGSYYGILAPAGTPPEIVTKLNAAIKETLTTPELKRTMATLDNDIVGAGPNEFEAFLRNDIEKWRKAAKIAGIKPQ